MNLEDIQNIVKEILAQDLDNRAGDAPTDAQLKAQLNEAARELSTDVRPVERLQLAYTPSDPTISLDSGARRILAVWQVQVNGVAIRDYRGRRRIDTFEQLALDIPGFESGGTPGLPKRAAMLGRELYLYPAPVAGHTITVVADTYFPDMPATLAEPVLMPKELAEACAYYAAVLAAESRQHVTYQVARLNATKERGKTIAAKWRAEYDRQRAELGVGA